MKASR